ncbi:MAG: ankyrin repeat domain-containing protein [Gammaproteobacteria bacterium]
MPYHNLLAHEVPALLAQPDTVVLDVRDPASFARAHIEGAQPADEAVIAALIRKRNQNPPVLIYCYHGNSSRELAIFLAGLGFKRVYNLEGGWQAWEAFRMQRTAQLSAGVSGWAEALGFDAGNLNSLIDNGMSMLMTAAAQGHHDIALELLQAGAEPNLVNDDGNNALWFACFSANTGLIHALIGHGTHLDNQNVNGATCLIYAASAGKFDVVKILVDAGADLDPTTLDGFNALDSAATLPVLKYLRPHYAAA